MTAGEAHAYLEDVQRDLTRNRNDYPQEIIEANGVAIFALEKQIPEKPTLRKTPINTKFKLIEYECPKCHTWKARQVKFCSSCGQALDWSDTE